MIDERKSSGLAQKQAAQNSEYLSMVDRSVAQLEQGKGKAHELIDVEDE